MPDENFNKGRARLVRDLASRADPFIRRRLLALAEKYDAADHKADGGASHADVTAPGPATDQ